ncbi:MAG: hypothetical protein ABII88_07480 [Candidatus Omnitrophota bacterium]
MKFHIISILLIQALLSGSSVYAEVCPDGGQSQTLSPSLGLTENVVQNFFSAVKNMSDEFEVLDCVTVKGYGEGNIICHKYYNDHEQLRQISYKDGKTAVSFEYNEDGALKGINLPGYDRSIMVVYDTEDAISNPEMIIESFLDLIQNEPEYYRYRVIALALESLRLTPHSLEFSVMHTTQEVLKKIVNALEIHCTRSFPDCVNLSNGIVLLDRSATNDSAGVGTANAAFATVYSQEQKDNLMLHGLKKYQKELREKIEKNIGDDASLNKQEEEVTARIEKITNLIYQKYHRSNLIVDYDRFLLEARLHAAETAKARSKLLAVSGVTQDLKELERKSAAGYPSEEDLPEYKALKEAREKLADIEVLIRSLKAEADKYAEQAQSLAGRNLVIEQELFGIEEQIKQKQEQRAARRREGTLYKDIMADARLKDMAEKGAEEKRRELIEDVLWLQHQHNKFVEEKKANRKEIRKLRKNAGELASKRQKEEKKGLVVRELVVQKRGEFAQARENAQKEIDQLKEKTLQSISERRKYLKNINVLPYKELFRVLKGCKPGAFGRITDLAQTIIIERNVQGAFVSENDFINRMEKLVDTNTAHRLAGRICRYLRQQKVAFDKQSLSEDEKSAAAYYFYCEQSKKNGLERERKAVQQLFDKTEGELDVPDQGALLRGKIPYMENRQVVEGAVAYFHRHMSAVSYTIHTSQNVSRGDFFDAVRDLLFERKQKLDEKLMQYQCYLLQQLIGKLNYLELKEGLRGLNEKEQHDLKEFRRLLFLRTKDPDTQRYVSLIPAFQALRQAISSYERPDVIPGLLSSVSSGHEGRWALLGRDYKKEFSEEAAHHFGGFFDEKNFGKSLLLKNCVRYDLFYEILNDFLNRHEQTKWMHSYRRAEFIKKFYDNYKERELNEKLREEFFEDIVKVLDIGMNIRIALSEQVEPILNNAGMSKLFTTRYALTWDNEDVSPLYSEEISETGENVNCVNFGVYRQKDRYKARNAVLFSILNRIVLQQQIGSRNSLSAQKGDPHKMLDCECFRGVSFDYAKLSQVDVSRVEQILPRMVSEWAAYILSEEKSIRALGLERRLTYTRKMVKLLRAEMLTRILAEMKMETSAISRIIDSFSSDIDDTKKFRELLKLVLNEAKEHAGTKDFAKTAEDIEKQVSRECVVEIAARAAMVEFTGYTKENEDYEQLKAVIVPEYMEYFTEIKKEFRRFLESIEFKDDFRVHFVSREEFDYKFPYIKGKEFFYQHTGDVYIVSGLTHSVRAALIARARMAHAQHKGMTALKSLETSKFGDMLKSDPMFPQALASTLSLMGADDPEQRAKDILSGKHGRFNNKVLEKLAGKEEKDDYMDFFTPEEMVEEVEAAFKRYNPPKGFPLVFVFKSLRVDLAMFDIFPLTDPKNNNIQYTFRGGIIREEKEIEKDGKKIKIPVYKIMCQGHDLRNPSVFLKQMGFPLEGNDFSQPVYTACVQNETIEFSRRFNDGLIAKGIEHDVEMLAMYRGGEGETQREVNINMENVARSGRIGEFLAPADPNPKTIPRSVQSMRGHMLELYNEILVLKDRGEELTYAQQKLIDDVESLGCLLLMLDKFPLHGLKKSSQQILLKRLKDKQPQISQTKDPLEYLIRFWKNDKLVGQSI